MFQPTLRHSAVLLLGTLNLSCSGTGNPSPQAFALPPVDSLIVTQGPEAADTVLVFAQGGPFPNLRPQLVAQLPVSGSWLRVTVQQPWTLNASLLSDPDGITQSGATELNLQAMEMLDVVVQYFREREKTVCVVGHSYGALLSLSWLATYDRKVPVNILAGRLSLPEIIWRNFQEGRLYWFPDGTTPQPIEGNTPRERIVAMRLQADLGSKRFMELLRGFDLSKLTFVYGDRDRLVGSLTSEEVTFLETRGARVVRLHDGDHRDMFDASKHDAIGTLRC